MSEQREHWKSKAGFILAAAVQRLAWEIYGNSLTSQVKMEEPPLSLFILFVLH